jgi:predicted Zn finger-like uncharacterized protein
MAFAVVCKSCQARFLLNDDLLRRKVAGRVVTVRCRQCQDTIEVDASDVDPESIPEMETAARAPADATPKRARPAPPPRTAKSTLMGIGAPRTTSSSDMVALSPGFLEVKPAPEPVASPHGFPEPPPPPEAVEVLDAGDWVEETSPPVEEEAAPESLDDFAEELPPSVPPEEEMPSSAGTPSLKALAHHDGQPNKPRVDDFLTNMTAAMNGGIMTGAPTIDVSGLTATPSVNEPPSIDVSNLGSPVVGAKTLPLVTTSEDKPDEAKPSAVTPAPSPAEGSLSPAALDHPAPEGSKRAERPRERKKAAVAPATKSAPAPTVGRKPSGLAAPLLLALAAAAGFLIWKRSGAHTPEAPVAEERPSEQVVAPPAAEPVAVASPVAEQTSATPSAGPPPPPAESPAPGTAPSKLQAGALTPVVAAAAPAAAPATQPASSSVPMTEPAGAVAKEEPKPEAASEPEAPAEPAGPFDKAAAAAALNASAGQASACRKEGDPSGIASVVVTFAPSGRVTSANISGPPFAGTPTGGCIAAALRKTKIPAFDGERVTVSKTVVIQ